MATGILIIARLGSTRLRDKHLLTANGKTFIEWLIGRFSEAFSNEILQNEVKIVVATSNMSVNQKFEDYLNSKTEIFYGSDSNIPLRQLQCAEHLELERIISVDGDDVLCSVEAGRLLYDKLKLGTEAAKTIGLPIGLNVMGYSKVYLEKCLSDYSNNDKFETGWGRIFDEEMQEVPLELPIKENYSQLRFTLDYPEDAQFFRNILSHFGKRITTTSDEELVKYVITNDVYKINGHLSEQYADNFNKLKDDESQIRLNNEL